ncbi:acetate--CoA ligase family protein [Halarchaeum nitratireducens]|uniref:acetate--CoA ligase family protein n=1 Tax=Halarchaeum nitratireducens TaxID=489913 RepID=UPI001668100A|nr:acetate--CoA ligase family protein [Halarchaeum nitratireducens]MBP2250963.1 acetyltransferase [Halarchaeum solikamskense]
MRDLSGLFEPDRVAVVGATERPGSVGRALFENLADFDGDVVPVNPSRDSVFGHACYASIGDVPRPATVDLAVVAVPAATVVDAVGQLGEAGVENVVVVTAGFREAGERGGRLERDLRETALTHDINLVGPNCVGIISTPAGLNATFLRGTPPAGSISLLSQSGAFIAAAIGWAARNDVGLKDVVSLGNEAVLDETDFIAEWAADPETDVVLAYLEDVDDGRRFIETARSVSAETPIVALKAGRTDAGGAAAASHTGAMAGSDEAYQAAFAQSGVVRAMDVESAFDFARALTGLPVPDHDDVAIVTNGGGPGVLATDAVGDSRLSLADFDASTREALADVLPTPIAAANPLDVRGDADVDRFREALDVVAAADEVGGVIVLCVPTGPLAFDDLGAVIGGVRSRVDKPVVTALMGGAEVAAAESVLGSHGVPNYFDPARAVESLAVLADYRDGAVREHAATTAFDVDTERAERIVIRALDRGVDHLGVEAMELLDAYGIPTPAGGLAESEEGAARIAASIEGPVVLKLASPDVVHKSDVGGVEVGVPTEDVRETYRAIVERARDHDPDATVLGVRVEATVTPAAGVETIVGAKRDPQFGHLVMFGLGGIFVQVFEDAAFRVAPVSERDAREMTREIQAAPMLRGARGREPADVDAVVETIRRVSQLVSDLPAITELDINPLVVSPEGVCALDFRARLDAAARPGDDCPNSDPPEYYSDSSSGSNMSSIAQSK